MWKLRELCDRAVFDSLRDFLPMNDFFTWDTFSYLVTEILHCCKLLHFKPHR